MLGAPNSLVVTALRKKAVITLQDSTELFEQAYTLLRDGQLEEAEELKEKAQSKRTESSWLITEANRLETREIGTIKFNAN